MISNSWPLCWLVSSSPPKKLSKILLRFRSPSFAPIWRSHGPGNKSSSMRRLKIETVHLISILELWSGYRNIMNLKDWKVFISSLRKLAEKIQIKLTVKKVDGKNGRSLRVNGPLFKILFKMDGLLNLNSKMFMTAHIHLLYNPLWRWLKFVSILDTLLTVIFEHNMIEFRRLAIIIDNLSHWFWIFSIFACINFTFFQGKPWISMILIWRHNDVTLPENIIEILHHTSVSLPSQFKCNQISHIIFALFFTFFPLKGVQIDV